jgi:glycerol uptake facilitator-like aquaporin
MVFAGFVIAIGLLIAGIQMITAGATGTQMNIPDSFKRAKDEL